MFEYSRYGSDSAPKASWVVTSARVRQPGVPIEKTPYFLSLKIDNSNKMYRVYFFNIHTLQTLTRNGTPSN